MGKCMVFVTKLFHIMHFLLVILIKFQWIFSASYMSIVDIVSHSFLLYCFHLSPLPLELQLNAKIESHRNKIYIGQKFPLQIE